MITLIMEPPAAETTSAALTSVREAIKVLHDFNRKSTVTDPDELLSCAWRHQITQEKFANGSGEAFWLVIVPEDVAMGTGVAQFTCGQGTVRQQFTIT